MDVAVSPAAAGGAPADIVERWAVPVAVLVVGMFMSVLDLTIVNVAIPAVQSDFGGSADDVLWIATAYTLTLGVIVPVTSWLGDRFGLTRLYIGAMLGFAAASALCGLAWNLDVLIAFRILQAIPGGILPVVTLTIVYRIVPSHQVGVAMGCYGFGAIVAPAVGPVLGGYLVDYANWRFVFYINGPLGLLGAIAAYFLVPKIAKETAHRFDFTGFAVAALGLFAILLAASEGESWGWTGYRILGLLVFGVLCLALFVVIEMEVEHPLIDLRILKIGSYTLSISLVGVFFINILSTSFYIPVFLQVGQGKEAFVAGILMIPQAVVTFMMMPLSGLLYDKIGARWLATGGLLLCAYGTYLLAGMSADMTRENLLIWSCIRATGLGMAIMPIMTAAMAAVPPELSNQASALLNVFQQVAGALGLAALGALATGQGAQLLADRAALIRPNPAMPDLSGELSPDTFALVYRFGARLQTQVLGTAYANLFVVLTVLTLVCAFFALFLGSGAPTAAESRSDIAGEADADRVGIEAADVEAVDPAAAEVESVVLTPGPRSRTGSPELSPAR